MRVGLFPGQGIGPEAILNGLPEGEPLLEIANEFLGYDLRRRVIDETRGSRKLSTELAQPAIFVAGCISWQRSVSEGDGFDQLIGHSLGEYAALTAAGAMSFRSALSVVAVRAGEMQKIALQCPGGMVALLGLHHEDAAEIARSAGVYVANDNSPRQTVVAGKEKELAVAAEAARVRGGRAVRLGVQAAFHTPDIAPAAAEVRRALESIEVRSPRIPVISNVTARPYRAPGEVRELLVQQLTSTVRFRESVIWAWECRGRDFVDLGPGKVVMGLATHTIDALPESRVSAYA